MKKSLLAFALVGMLATPAMADVVLQSFDPLPLYSGDVSLGGTPRGTMVYDNRTTLLAAYAQPPGTEIGDEVTLAPGPRWLDSLYWTVFNGGASDLNSINMTAKFYSDWTAGTLLGTVALGSYTFPSPLPGGYYTTFSATDLYAAGVRILLTDVPLWSMTFTNLQMLNVGHIIADPPTIGSSTDDFWKGPPPGGWYWFGGSPVANFYFGIDTVVPEPATLALLAFGALALIRRR